MGKLDVARVLKVVEEEVVLRLSGRVEERGAVNKWGNIVCVMCELVCRLRTEQFTKVLNVCVLVIPCSVSMF